ncbi:MAG: hypothetical protein IMY67_12220 [Bacteroidetes bacterium]|nr:hypothetical protein [Bacteroidota bacterium]
MNYEEQSELITSAIEIVADALFNTYKAAGDSEPLIRTLATAVKLLVEGDAEVRLHICERLMNRSRDQLNRKKEKIQ